MEQTPPTRRAPDASSSLGARRLHWRRRRGPDDDTRALTFASTRAAEDFVRGVLTEEPARRVLLGFVARQHWPHAARWAGEALVAQVARALVRGEVRVEAPGLRVGPPRGPGVSAPPAPLPEDTRERKALYAEVRGGWETRSMSAAAAVDWDTNDLRAAVEVDWNNGDLATGVEATWMTRDLATGVDATSMTRDLRAGVDVPPAPPPNEPDEEGEPA
ncbi:MAG: hypothetical protein U0325_22990 [Polyangiales bacterium]